MPVAPLQVITFDEAAEQSGVPGGLRFRSEFVHTMSLMHALAMQVRPEASWRCRVYSVPCAFSPRATLQRADAAERAAARKSALRLCVCSRCTPWSSRSSGETQTLRISERVREPRPMVLHSQATTP